MKSRYSTVDIKAVIYEIREQFAGLRVTNVYDVDNKTYLIKFAKPESKKVLLLESGIRIHITEYDWPKSPMPSGFSMKLRKHLKSRRLEDVIQLGCDRIIRLQFGSGDAAYYVVLELYDKGNIVLTDHEFTTLNILRPREDNSQDVKFVVREKYPMELAKAHEGPPTVERLHEVLSSSKPNENLRKLLNPMLPYGPAVIDHCLLAVGFPPSASLGKDFDVTNDVPKLLIALDMAEDMMHKCELKCQGFIIQKAEKNVRNAAGEEILVYDEFHPFLYKQHEGRRYVQFDTFNQAVDRFFSQMEAQKIEMKALQAEKAALKKLENVKIDHEKRLQELQQSQELDERKALIIEGNLALVDKALVVIQSALANQFSWSDIEDIIKEAKSQNDPVALSIKSLKLEKNHFSMLLKDPYSEENMRPVEVEIDLELSAHGNAKKYYDQKRHALSKEQKTIDASAKALKSAERKTKQALIEMKVTANIVKARKAMWFEKFNWFISSENYLVLSGRDGQQNELLVRRYLRAGDVYVHADLHGASSIVIKNRMPGEPIPPKTLNESGTMAICTSAAWDAKVVTSAWWVYHDQVSKTAPSGEYLTTGSFMIRGKKNFLPPSYLVYGFGILFKLDEDSVERHKGERKVRTIESDNMSIMTESDNLSAEQEVELIHEESDGEEDNIEMQENDAQSNVKRSPVELIRNEVDILKSSGSEVISEERSSTDNSKTVINHEVKEEAQGAEGEEDEERQAESEENDADDLENEFPDTKIHVHPVAGLKFEVRPGKENQLNEKAVLPEETEPQGSGSTKSKPSISRKQRREMKKQKSAGGPLNAVEEAEDGMQDGNNDNIPVSEKCSNTQNQKQPQKRGQHGKLKKMKKKYADQDEEEREIRSAMLHTAERETKKRLKLKAQEKQKSEQQARRAEQQKNLQEKKAKPTRQQNTEATSQNVPDYGEEDLDDDSLQTEQMDVLDTLTGLPVDEDTLLYAIPFCAPYSAMQNFKYKVKLTPGTTKRGKAVKVALQAFLYDRSTTQREKDLLKSLKDVDMSRNIPGKVKVTSSQLAKSKSKK